MEYQVKEKVSSAGIRRLGWVLRRSVRYFMAFISLARVWCVYLQIFLFFFICYYFSRRRLRSYGRYSTTSLRDLID